MEEWFSISWSWLETTASAVQTTIAILAFLAAIKSVCYAKKQIKDFNMQKQFELRTMNLNFLINQLNIIRETQINLEKIDLILNTKQFLNQLENHKSLQAKVESLKKKTTNIENKLKNSYKIFENNKKFTIQQYESFVHESVAVVYSIGELKHLSDIFLLQMEDKISY
ncbi:hypothetical protein [Acinetobacter radioresistens]|uniref:hypothetical protein n=1 Tax=Acinetobacter radioresistens TaxID=40216 RepID=UPI002246D2AE|nr:hypothetical protein [Acinetobacter radioresistens]MCX0338297.1 hypothetical protein [Acinetobacter radioresistens]